MATLSKPLFSVGDMVAVRGEGGQRIGEVVGQIIAPYGYAYDVSVEDVVLKAISQADMVPATTRDLQSLLMTLVGYTTQASSERDVFLLQRYVEVLTRALDRLEGSSDEDDRFQCMPLFELGQRLAVREGDVWVLATVHGISRVGETVRYDVDAMSEMRRVDEQQLKVLDEVKVASGLGLGARARFVVNGHEHDDAYAGTVCALAPTEDGWEYSLVFDDGDVLEGLAAQDLIPA